MEITITINGKPVQATVDDAVIREAMSEKTSEKTSEKMTGYERHEHGKYYLQKTDGDVRTDEEIDHPLDQKRYQAGNYYVSKEVAENNARADKLMRNLRRFAAEHGGCGKPAIAACCPSRGFDVTIKFADGLKTTTESPRVGAVYFKDEDTAQAALGAFRDELTWYFTEYDPMPEGWWDS